MAIIVSFIIPHKGRHEMLVETVNSIMSQKFDPDAIEIVIVSQDKEPDSLRVALADSDNVVIVSRPESDSISALRNCGVRNCHSTRYIGFLDSDIVISSHWVQTMIEELRAKPERLIVSSIQEYSLQAGPIEKIRSLLSKINGNSKVDALAGSNLFLELSTFDRVGGFPEALRTCEDTYFTTKAATLGELYLSARTSHIHLGEDKNYRQLFIKEIWRGRSNFTSTKGRSINPREIPSLVIPPFVLITSFIAIILMLSFQPYAAMSALILSLCPIILYVLRLLKPGKDPSISIAEAFRFYYTYFLARAIGSTIGIFNQ